MNKIRKLILRGENCHKKETEIMEEMEKEIFEMFPAICDIIDFLKAGAKK